MKLFDYSYGIKYVFLRYLNATGSYETGEIWENHHPETISHQLIFEVPLCKCNRIYIFGEGYFTEDRVYVRDYIHIIDIASTHYKAI